MCPRGTPRVKTEKKEDRPPNNERHGSEPQLPSGVGRECGYHEHRRTDHGNYPSRYGYPPQAARMARSHISQVRWNGAAENYCTVNLALLRFRKAPERVRLYTAQL